MSSTAQTAIEPDVTEAMPMTTVEALTRGEVDIQIATAKRYPRSLRAFKERALEMATLDQDTAESCIYALPRDGKTIEGPSARLAEILASAYGHMRVEGRPVDDDGRFVTARGTAWDIQNNVLIAFEVKRRVTNKSGRRFSDDMITVTNNAATSIAIRNAILKVVPKAFWGPIYEACRKVAVGDASTLANRRAAMLEYFLKMGVTNEKVFHLLQVAGIEDITLDHMATLKGLATAIKEGDTTVDEAFPSITPESSRPKNLDDLTQQLKETAAASEMPMQEGASEPAATGAEVAESNSAQSGAAETDNTDNEALNAIHRQLQECRYVSDVSKQRNSWTGPASKLSDLEKQAINTMCDERIAEIKRAKQGSQQASLV
jgi:hypothetical protein